MPMKYKYLFVPLGVDNTPIGQRKCIDPVLGAALITGGVQLLGSLLGSSSQSAANATNLEAVRETNAANKQIADDVNRMSQVQFERNMDWMKTQYYDTDQYKRLVEALGSAGLNPALAYGHSSPVGSVGAPSQSNFHAAQMEAGHVEPVRFGDALSESVGAATNAYFQNQLLNEQAQNVNEDSQTKRINNATQAQRNMLELHNLYEDAQNKLAQRNLSKEQREYYSKLKEQISRQLDLFNATFDDMVYREKKQNDILNADEDNIKSQTAINKINAMFLPAIHRAGIRLSKAQSDAALGAAAQSWELAKTYYHERHDMMPLKQRYQDLVNNYLSIRYGNQVSYENFVKSNRYDDERNMLKILGELFDNIPVSSFIK